MKKYITLAWVALTIVSAQVLAQNPVTVETVVSAGLQEPFAVAVDLVTNAIYITDSVNNRIAKYADNGQLTTVAGMIGVQGNQDETGFRARFYSPQGIVLSGNRLLVSDSGNHLIRAVTLDGAVTTVAGSTVGFADGKGAAAQFNSPAGLALDSDGNLYIADVLNHAIRKMTPDGVVSTVVSTNLYRPSGVGLGPNGRLFIADSGNNCIKVWENNTLTLFAGRDSRSEYGNADALFADKARFNNPMAVLWRGNENGLLVSDTGNGVIRRVFYNANMTVWSVETFAVTGPAGVSKPVGLAVDNTDSVLIADLGDNSIKRLPSSLVTQPAVAPPLLGIVQLSTNLFGVISSELLQVTNMTFINDTTIAVIAEPGTEVFYTIGPTRNPRAVPDPDRNSLSPPWWIPGVVGSVGDPIDLLLPPNIVNPITPDVTVKVVGMAAGRKPSSIVVGQFRFQVANPYIDGINMAAFTLTNYTEGAELYYTKDGSEPTTNSTHYSGGRLSIFDGTTNDVTFKVRGFKEGYHPSSIVVQTFEFKNLKTSTIGLTRTFQAGPGATIVVPVEINLLSGDVLQSLQFRVEVEPDQAGAPLISTNNFRAILIGTNNFIQLPVPATVVTKNESYVREKATGLAVGFIGPHPPEHDFENPYNDLIMSISGPVILLAVQIPQSATADHSYTLRVLEPSGTFDGYQGSVMLSSLVNRKIEVLLDTLGYVVGDIAPSYWYNAGDFGNTNLNNSDVNTIFAASMGYRTPFSFSDVFDAMDAFPIDTATSVGGDGLVRYLDWNQIFYRSLRLDTNNWRRIYGAQGRYTARTALGNAFANTPAESIDNSGSNLAWFRHAQIMASPVENVNPGQRVNVPIYLNVKPNCQVAGLQFRAIVVPEDNAPALTYQAEFIPANGMPAPPWKLNAAANDILHGWSLGGFNPPLTSKVLLGYLRFSVPTEAEAGQSYAVHFTGTDGAPDLQTQYDFESIPATVWVECAAKRPAETLSDEWKLKFFGSLTHPQAVADADPDGDGSSNGAEFARGSNPINLHLYPCDLVSNGSVANGIQLRWFGESGKRYRVEAATRLDPILWRIIAGNLMGQGNVMERTVIPTSSETGFYRVRSY
jgi:hypothetical protein